ncbi:BMC domain-containing protein [Heliobacillus mobilis]|nr:BMC domain-containing protein [Heliobacterium mobile]MTV47982.1 BMC domain-containing protein [Heliobacterium mobile]
MKHAIGLLEIENVTKGILAADTMLKSGNVELVVAQPMCPGKYIVLVSGDVGAVQSAVRSGQAVAKESVVNDFVLPNVHPSIFPALNGCSEVKQIRALGVIETYSVASAVVAADTAVKAAGVELIEIRLARGLGGKSIISLTGDVGAVSAAIQAGSHVIKESGFLVDQIVIPAPHKGLQASIF